MNIFEIIGIITVVVILLRLFWKIYRRFFPKKYTWENCPNDHDTMTRYGYSGKCDKCGNEI